MTRLRSFVGLLALVASPLRSQSDILRPETVAVLGATRAAVGSESEAGPELFGGIRGVAIDRRGALYVLDGMDASIRMFDASGRFVARIGKPGRGPGDFTTPWSIFHDGDSTLLVADQVNGLSEIRTSPTGMRFVRAFGADLMPRAACRFEGELLVAGFREEHVLHFLSASGTVSRSIGAPFNQDSIAAVRAFANRAPLLLACSPAARLIVVAQASGSAVRAYTLAGDVKWEVTLPDYRGNFYLRDRRGAVTVGYGEDATESLTLLNDSTLLVQVVRVRRLPGGVGRSRRLDSERTRVVTSIIDLSTGRVRARGTRLGSILAVRGNVAAEVQHEPFPQVQLRALTVR